MVVAYVKCGDDEKADSGLIKTEIVSVIISQALLSRL